MLVTTLLALVTCGAFALLLAGVEVSALKELLTILFPPLVALTAAGWGGNGRGRRVRAVAGPPAATNSI